ncbi:putative potassium transporter 17 [Drosera capensis]
MAIRVRVRMVLDIRGQPTMPESIVVVDEDNEANGVDVESLRFPLAVQDGVIQKPSRWRTLLRAYKTLGVVFGGLVTSPLYVYPLMLLKSTTEQDYLGISSIMFWILTPIGVVKYASITLKADDQGEGGNFALYSLLCRKMMMATVFPFNQTKVLEAGIFHQVLHCQLFIQLLVGSIQYQIE